MIPSVPTSSRPRVVVDELHFEDELLDGGFTELAQDLAICDSLAHRPIMRAFRFPATGLFLG